MTNEEAIKYLRQIYPNGGHCWLDSQRIEAIEMAIRALSQPSLPSNLDEAAKKWKEEHFRREYYQTPKDAMSRSFKAGAKCMAEQGITVRKKIEKINDGSTQIPTYCNGFKITELDVPFLNSKECGYGNEVIVQIRKK